MRQIFSIIAAMMLCFGSANLAASSLDLRGLTPQQVAELQQQANQLKDQTPDLVQKASQWGELGANIGTAMVAAAKELGVAANEFAQTGIGKVTIGVIIYKIVGRDVLRFLMGFVIVLVGSVVGVKYMLNGRYEKIEYVHTPFLWGLATRSKVANRSAYHFDGDTAAGGFVMTAVCWIIGGIIAFA